MLNDKRRSLLNSALFRADNRTGQKTISPFSLALILRLILKIFKITVKTAATINFSPTYGSAALSLSMLIMVLIFIISVYTKKSTGKLLDDIV